MKLIEDLKWRYATKSFQNRRIPEHDLEVIIEAINLSASSTGLQPYRLVVVEDQQLKKELGEGSFNLQIAESSHLIVFAAYSSIDQQMIDEYIQRTARVRSMPVENLTEFHNNISGYLLSRSDEENFNWSSRQAYIGLGTGLVAAANLRIDATPMEGFDAEKFDTLLGLKERNLKSVVILALGYRDEERDYLANLKKVRVAKDEFATLVH